MKGALVLLRDVPANWRRAMVGILREEWDDHYPELRGCMVGVRRSPEGLTSYQREYPSGVVCSGEIAWR